MGNGGWDGNINGRMMNSPNGGPVRGNGANHHFHRGQERFQQISILQLNNHNSKPSFTNMFVHNMFINEFIDV